MKKEEYHSILVRHAIPSGKRLFGSAWIFQQDNDPKHTSKMCKSYIEKKVDSGEMLYMEWSPQSSDLSPIELLWEEVDRQVQAKRPSSAARLAEIVQRTWSEISEDILEKLLRRMPLCAKLLLMQEVVTLMKNWQLKKSNLCTTRYSCILPLVIFISPISTH